MPTKYLRLPDGTLAFDDQGHGPLVLCMPAGGDLRSEYRFLVPQLVAAGYRVVTMDMRGQGDASVRWPAYTDAALGADMLAVLAHLGVDGAFLIGTSKATGGALQAALQAPERVHGLVLISPLVAAPRSAWRAKLLVWALLSPLWGVAVYNAWFPKMYPLARPADFEAHRQRVRAMLAQPGRLRALRLLFSESTGATYHRHADVRAPTLIVMGTSDPDVADPTLEASTLAARLPQATVQLVDGAGHHPHVEVPQLLGPAITTFLARHMVHAGVAHVGAT